MDQQQRHHGYGTANYRITRDEIWLNSNWTSHDADGDMYYGGYGFQTYMHEIGHALGLSHPGTYNAGNGGAITYAGNAEYSLDNRQYTIMSYFGGYRPGVGWQQEGHPPAGCIPRRRCFTTWRRSRRSTEQT